MTIPYKHPVRQDDRLCLLLIICVTKHRYKELVGLEDAIIES
ncbi:MAG: hypothetical protein ACTS73_04200 [Arsenophonus sp. NEOnobi-MAG3]